MLQWGCAARPGNWSFEISQALCKINENAVNAFYYHQILLSAPLLWQGNLSIFLVLRWFLLNADIVISGLFSSSFANIFLFLSPSQKLYMKLNNLLHYCIATFKMSALIVSDLRGFLAISYCNSCMKTQLFSC